MSICWFTNWSNALNILQQNLRNNQNLQQRNTSVYNRKLNSVHLQLRRNAAAVEQLVHEHLQQNLPDFCRLEGIARFRSECGEEESGARRRSTCQGASAYCTALRSTTQFTLLTFTYRVKTNVQTKMSSYHNCNLFWLFTYFDTHWSVLFCFLRAMAVSFSSWVQLSERMTAYRSVTVLGQAW